MFTAVIRSSVCRFSMLLAGAGIVAAVGLSAGHPAAAAPARADGVSVTVTVGTPATGPVVVPPVTIDSGVAGWD